MTAGSPAPAQRADLGSRVFANSALALVCRLVTALSAFCLIPFVIHRLGIAGYGVWETITSLGFVLFLLQNIITGTLLWWMSQAYGRGDLAALCRSAGLGFFSLMVFFCLAVPLAWLARDALAGFLNIPLPDRATFTVVMPLYVALFVASGGTEVLAALVGASQRMGESLLCQAAGRIVQYGVAIAALLTGHGLASLVIGLVCGTMVYGFLLIRILRSLYPGLRLCPLVPTREEVAALYRYAGFMAAGSVASVLREQTDKIILAACASPIWVGYYGIATRLASLLLDFNRFFYPPLTAAVGALHARGDHEGVSTIYHRVLTSVILCTGMVFIGVLGGYDRLMFSWLGALFPQVAEILLLLVLGNTVTVLFAGPQTALCRGIGRNGIESSYVMVTLVANLVATLALVLLMGPMGTVYASAATSLGGALLFSRLFHRNLAMPLRGTMTALGSLAVAMVMAGAVRGVFLLLDAPATRGGALASLVAVALPACAVYLVVLFMTGIVDRDEVRGVLLLGRRGG